MGDEVSWKEDVGRFRDQKTQQLASCNPNGTVPLLRRRPLRVRLGDPHSPTLDQPPNARSPRSGLRKHRDCGHFMSAKQRPLVCVLVIPSHTARSLSTASSTSLGPGPSSPFFQGESESGSAGVTCRLPNVGTGTLGRCRRRAAARLSRRYNSPSRALRYWQARAGPAAPAASGTGTGTPVPHLACNPGGSGAGFRGA